MRIYSINEDKDDEYYQFDGGSDSESSSDDEDTKQKKEKHGDKIKEASEANKTALADGIVKERGCVDWWCFIIFMAFICAMFYAVIYGYQNGQVQKLTAPMDANNNFCGFENTGGEDMTGYGKLIFTDLTLDVSDVLTSGVCLKKCPTGSDDNEFNKDANCKSNSKVACSAAVKAYKTKDFFDFCIPAEKGALSKEEWATIGELKKQFKDSETGAFFTDLYNSSRAIYISCGMAFFWGMFFIYLMAYFAEQIAWCIVGLLQCGLLCATIVSFLMWGKAQQKLAEEDASIASKDKGPKFWLVSMITFGIMTMIFCCMVFCFRNDLAMAIDVIDAAADFLRDNKRVFLSPVLHAVLQVVFVIIWIGGFICVASLNEFKPMTGVPQGRDLEWTKKTQYMAAFMVFGFLWISAWIEYTSNFIVMVSAATYYFNNKADKDENEPDEGADICFGVKCAYVHHIGSVAVGSFIIALVRFIKYVLFYLIKQIEEKSGDNESLKCMLNCAKCCLNCIEDIVEYINNAAFAYMAVMGTSFITSAWRGFLLNICHGAKFFFAKTIAQGFIFIGKAAIVSVNCFTVFVIMKYITKDTEEVKSIWGPIIVVGIVTFFAASLFLSSFDEAVNALLTSLCCDIDVNGKPMYGPKTFHDKRKKIKKKGADQRKAKKQKQKDKKAKKDEDGGEAPNEVE